MNAKKPINNYTSAAKYFLAKSEDYFVSRSSRNHISREEKSNIVEEMAGSRFLKLASGYIEEHRTDMAKAVENVKKLIFSEISKLEIRRTGEYTDKELRTIAFINDIAEKVVKNKYQAVEYKTEVEKFARDYGKGKKTLETDSAKSAFNRLVEIYLDEHYEGELIAIYRAKVIGSSAQAVGQDIIDKTPQDITSTMSDIINNMALDFVAAESVKLHGKNVEEVAVGHYL